MPIKGKALKVLLVTTFFHPDKFGGAERVVFELARNLSRLDHEVTVLTHRSEGTPEKEELFGFRVIRYPASARGRTAFYASVYRNARAKVKALLKKESFDILHTHQLLSAFAATFPSCPLRTKWAASFYAPYHQEFETKYLEGKPASEAKKKLPLVPALLSRVLKWGDCRVLTRAGAVIVLSRFSLGQAEALAGGKTRRIDVVPAGVDTDHFRPPEQKNLLRQRMGLDEKAPLLFTVRRLVERMGLEDLIDACGLLAEQGIPFDLAIGGEGPLRAKLEERAAATPAAGRIRFLGRIPEDELPDRYGACDLFVLPTRSLEGFGMVTLEALACGVPVAATAVGATPEILSALDEALLFQAPGAGAMASHLARLLSDPARLEALGKKARALAEAEYPWSRAARQTQKIYERVLGGNGKEGRRG